MTFNRHAGSSLETFFALCLIPRLLVSCAKQTDFKTCLEYGGTAYLTALITSAT